MDLLKRLVYVGSLLFLLSISIVLSFGLGLFFYDKIEDQDKDIWLFEKSLGNQIYYWSCPFYSNPSVDGEHWKNPILRTGRSICVEDKEHSTLYKSVYKVDKSLLNAIEMKGGLYAQYLYYKPYSAFIGSLWLFYYLAIFSHRGASLLAWGRQKQSMH
ncbi:hypothetical protein Q7I30_13025 [Aeromonas veronii]|uniref:hypothetical protein n=1 Tax=Aeromonas veronii TaxID=654 RepID=UPI001F4867DC|nr:hypothetical protein [Aeromonas veronii]MCF5853677.1 hypothetical protein [Aeromonas veronii]